jgi:hypothetical protein
MLKGLLVLSTLSLVIFAGAFAVCGEVIIDDFEDGDISDWIVPYSPGKANLTLTDFAHSGSYAVNSSADPVDWGWNDFTKENLGIELPHPVSYYNLSFWYFIPEGVEMDEWWVYLGYNNSVHFGAPYVGYTQEFHLDSVDDLLGQWIHLSLAMNENLNDPEYRFYPYDSRQINSIYLLPQPRVGYVLFDDIKLVPTRVTDEGWSCSAWGLCFLGLERRSCAELDSCGASQPSEQRACALWEPLALLGVVMIVTGVYKLWPRKKPKKRKRKK